MSLPVSLASSLKSLVTLSFPLTAALEKKIPNRLSVECFIVVFSTKCNIRRQQILSGVLAPFRFFLNIRALQNSWAQNCHNVFLKHPTKYRSKNFTYLILPRYHDIFSLTWNNSRYPLARRAQSGDTMMVGIRPHEADYRTCETEAD